MSEVFTAEEPVPPPLEIYCNDKPSYCHKESTIVLLSGSKLYQYNINTKLLTFDILPISCALESTGLDIYSDNKYRYQNQLMDESKDIIYLLSDKKIYSINIKMKNLKLICDGNNTLNECNSFQIISYIPSPLNQIHIIDKYKYFIYNINNGNTIKSYFELYGNEGIIQPKLIYIPFKKQLMIFGSDSNKIFYNNHDMNKFEKWKKYPLTMPHKVKHDAFDILLAFKTLLFIFYFHNYEIWCLDLINTTFYKSNYKIPYLHSTKLSKIQYTLKETNNTLHIIDSNDVFSRLLTRSGDAHSKASLYKLIPNEIYKEYSFYYQKLVFGYIRQTETANIIPTMPYVLKQLISMYIPSFM